MRNGADYWHRDGLDEDGEYYRLHTFYNVYSEMLLQICKDYSTLPDIRKMTAREIKFFYEGCRNDLKEATKQRNK